MSARQPAHRRAYHGLRARISARIRRELHRRGFHHTEESFRVDLDPTMVDTIKRVQDRTMTSPERIAALCSSVEYLVANDIPGAIVECGVWLGGSMLAAAHTLQRLGAADRELWLFDTFVGMTRPEDMDVDYRGVPAIEQWTGFETIGTPDVTPEFLMENIRAALERTGYDMARVRLVKGPVEETVPGHAPSAIALLRLDTDWYKSTKHELEHLYPRLVEGGVLIIDDYGHYRGARQATDEYFAGRPVLLNRIDYSGRLVVKPGEALSRDPISRPA